MGWGPFPGAVAMTASEQETVVIITAVDSDSQDETMSTDNGDKTVDRRKYFLWAVLSAALVLLLCAACVMISGGKFSGTPSGLTMRRPERLIQVYTPEQATRAAKAAVAQLQIIEQRQPHAMSAANPFALPPVRETDINTE